MAARQANRLLADVEQTEAYFYVEAGGSGGIDDSEHGLEALEDGPLIAHAR